MARRLDAILVRACAGTHLARPARPLPRGGIAGHGLDRRVTGESDCHSVACPANWSGLVADARR
ncbi:hypothetical protein [Micromonospora carbonacea]|uniref:Uncharacterized protein n=1 Tax=Micromonospora carbonacea TaxID=47853 RepID=A0A1C4YES9_9ACTN|nr:hypothetical protein [Micromonospora carbonacea]SCF19136.1 hypothetical protein GA0070563_10665 [Micromonospora carbonacea]